MMKLFLSTLLLIVLCPFLFGCGQEQNQETASVQSEAPDISSPSDSMPPDNFIALSIKSIEIVPFNQIPYLKTGAQYRYKLKITLSSGSIYYKTTDFTAGGDQLSGDIFWSVGNADLATIDPTGLLQAKLAGSTEIYAMLLGLKTSLPLQINEDLKLSNLNFSQEVYQVTTPQVYKLTLDYYFNDGSVITNKIPDEIKLPCPINIQTDHPQIALTTNAGILIPQQNGETVITINCGDQSASAIIQIIGAFQDPHVKQPPPIQTDNEHLESILILGDNTLLLGNGTYTYHCRLTFNTGVIDSVTTNYNTPAGNTGALTWDSSNRDIIEFDNQNRALPQGYGTTLISASTSGMTATKTVNTLINPQAPQDAKQHYLGVQDKLNIKYGSNAGFGSQNFPQTLYGPPHGLFLNHVLTFGFGGTLTIELNDYLIVDGPGIDFTIFENPIETGDFVFAERARVSVSEDGIHFTPFPCDVFDPDQFYTGCAGVHPFNESTSSIDPLVSGGDHYDLSDIEIPVIKWIKIEDAKTCIAGDVTYPLCAENGKEGFDMDALTIINGRREPININY